MAIIEVVKYDGPPDVFAWRYPNQELGTWTQLIVHETQEAILYRGSSSGFLRGWTAYTEYGEYTNIIQSNQSSIRREVSLYGRSLVCEQTSFTGREMGTSSPIQLQDPKYNIIVSVRAFGQFGVRISDPRKFLGTMVGTLPTFDQSTLIKYYRGVLMSNITEIISSYIVRKNQRCGDQCLHSGNIEAHHGSDCAFI